MFMRSAPQISYRPIALYRSTTSAGSGLNSPQAARRAGDYIHTTLPACAALAFIWPAGPPKRKKSPPARWSHGWAVKIRGLPAPDQGDSVVFGSGWRGPQGLAVGAAGGVGEVDGVGLSGLASK